MNDYKNVEKVEVRRYGNRVWEPGKIVNRLSSLGNTTCIVVELTD